MSRRTVTFLILLFIAGASHARVRNGAITAGFEVGTLVDINAKFYTSEYNAFEIKFSPNPGHWYLLGAGWKLHITNLFDFEPDIYFQYGIEGHFFSLDSDRHPFLGSEDGNDDFGISALGVAGFSYFPDEIPFDFYTDFGMGLTTTPELKLIFHFVVGVRFSFRG